MGISERIEQLRTSKNIRKADMAKVLEMDPSYYNKFEKRGDKLTIEQLERIAGALGVGLLELLTGEPQAVADGGRVKELEAEILRLKSLNDSLENDIDLICGSINVECQDKIIQYALENNLLEKHLYEKFIDVIPKSENDKEFRWYWQGIQPIKRINNVSIGSFMSIEQIDMCLTSLLNNRSFKHLFSTFFYYSVRTDRKDSFDTAIKTAYYVHMGTTT